MVHVRIGRSWQVLLKIMHPDPLVGHQQVLVVDELHQGGLAPLQTQHLALLPLHVPQGHLPPAHDQETVLRQGHHAVVGHVLLFLFAHQQVEVAVVQPERVLLLDQQLLAERVHEGNAHLQLVDLLQTVLGGWVDLVNGQLLLPHCKKLVLLTELQLPYLPRQLVVADFLGVEVEQDHVGFGLGHLAEQVVHIRLSLGRGEGKNSFERVQFDLVELVGANNLPLLHLFFLVLREGRPLEDILLLLVFGGLVEDEADHSVRRHHGRVGVDAVLQLDHCLLGHLVVQLQVVNLHLVVLFDLNLFLLHLATDGGLEHQAYSLGAHADDFLDYFSGVSVDDCLLGTAPHHDELLLAVDAHQNALRSKVQTLHRVLVRVNVKHWLCFRLQLPLFHPLVRYGVVQVLLLALAWRHDDLAELLLVVAEKPKFLPVLLGDNDHFVPGDLAIAARVDVSHVHQLPHAVEPLRQLPAQVYLYQTVGIFPVHVHDDFVIY